MTTPRKPYTIDRAALAAAQAEFERITREEEDGTRTPVYPDLPDYVQLPTAAGEVVAVLIPSGSPSTPTNLAMKPGDALTPGYLDQAQEEGAEAASPSRERQGLVIDLQDVDRGQPHWLNGMRTQGTEAQPVPRVRLLQTRRKKRREGVQR